MTFSIINRRPHKKDTNKDVLEKVTLIKDISHTKPHRAHIEILFDLSYGELSAKYEITNFLDLHNSWQKTLDTSELNKKFYRELSNWYFWAIDNVEFPPISKESREIRNATNTIRLLTRLIFVWFLKEKSLVPDELFNHHELKKMLNYSDKNKSTYYKAILQNLFFATLNTEMNKDKQGSRKFRGKNKGDGQDQHFMIHNVFRYQDYFVNPQDTLRTYFDGIPFLNGGLFECLDKIVEVKGKDKVIRIDGFSDHSKNELVVPDYLFYSSEKIIDLNETYGTSNKTYKVRGLIDILESYKFTVDENTPIEEEVALDPELLGKVFENLLASYNPETGTTARKQTGSFYTPREIVNYMVDESLIAYLTNVLQKDDSEERLRNLIAYTDEPHQFSSSEVDNIIHAIDNSKILDPAVGSGAYPMGVLHKLVYILSKLDVDNSKWKDLQRKKAIVETEEAERIGSRDERVQRLWNIEDVFENNTTDYGRKLYLIENCIFGIDIQPIAVQIAKLRFFISLIVNQKICSSKENLGIRPLPNLETKFVAANTLVDIEKPVQGFLRNPEIDKKEEELKRVREKHFTARTPKAKEKCRKDDERLRAEISKLMQLDGFPSYVTEKLAQWNPYSQHNAADFFDQEWMFGVTEGFDVIIGNPPYLNIKNQDEITKNFIRANYKYSKGADIYVAFVEKSIELLKKDRVLCFIVPNKFFGADYGKKIRAYLQEGNACLTNIWDLKDEKVFESALISTVVVVIEKIEGKKPTKLINGNQICLVDSLFDSNGKIQIEANSDDTLILQKMNKFTPLDEIADIRTGIMGFEYWKMEPIISSGIKQNSVRLYTNGNLKRYSDNWDSDIKLFKKEYCQPSIKLDKKYLNANTIELFQYSPKIIVRGVSKCLTGIIDYHGSALLVAVHAIIPTKIDIRYLLGIINSNLLNWFHLKTIYSIRIPQGSLKYPVSFFKKLPIAEHTKESKDKQIAIISLVKKIESVKQKNPDTDISAFESQIDSIVYELYGLTSEEVTLVEGSSTLDFTNESDDTNTIDDI